MDRRHQEIDTEQAVRALGEWLNTHLDMLHDELSNVRQSMIAAGELGSVAAPRDNLEDSA